MLAVDVNYLAILVAAIVSMVTGSVWYGPLFGKTWRQLVGKTEESVRKGAVQAMVIAAVSALVTAYVLAYISSYAQASTWQEGAVVGFWVWLGFVATTLLVHASFEDKPKNLYLLNVGSHLIEFVVMGAIIGAWV